MLNPIWSQPLPRTLDPTDRRPTYRIELSAMPRVGPLKPGFSKGLKAKRSAVEVPRPKQEEAKHVTKADEQLRGHFANIAPIHEYLREPTVAVSYRGLQAVKCHTPARMLELIN